MECKKLAYLTYRRTNILVSGIQIINNSITAVIGFPIDFYELKKNVNQVRDFSNKNRISLILEDRMFFALKILKKLLFAK